jgi:hypothetical protein
MAAGPPKPTIWARAISDEAFRDALILDPLRALAGAPGVSATPEEVERLEDMTEDERRDLVRRLLEEAMRRRVHRMWGDHFWTGDDPRPPAPPRE